jgi:putative redox protein
MADTSTGEITITLPGGRRVDARAGAHVVHTDQLREDGGEDSAPQPFQLFLASIGTCAGIYVQGFCARREIPTDGIRIVERYAVDEKKTLVRVDLDIELPPSFPEKYRDAVLRAVEGCSVKRSIQAQPEFRVATVRT